MCTVSLIINHDRDLRGYRVHRCTVHSRTRTSNLTLARISVFLCAYLGIFLFCLELYSLMTLCCSGCKVLCLVMLNRPPQIERTQDQRGNLIIECLVNSKVTSKTVVVLLGTERKTYLILFRYLYTNFNFLFLLYKLCCFVFCTNKWKNTYTLIVVNFISSYSLWLFYNSWTFELSTLLPFLIQSFPFSMYLHICEILLNY